MRRLVAAVLLGLALAAAPAGPAAFAYQPDEVLADPALESRARDLSAELRCMVCQNQSIDDSNADLAKDLRLLVRERLVAGDSDREVLDYLVSRYGEFVLMRPRLSWQTAALWSLPALLLLAGGGFLVAQARRRAAPTASGLSREEERAIARLLDKEGS
jgi:cytochrome c-type biogenesis protein CcmH